MGCCSSRSSLLPPPSSPTTGYFDREFSPSRQFVCQSAADFFEVRRVHQRNFFVGGVLVDMFFTPFFPPPARDFFPFPAFFSPAAPTCSHVQVINAGARSHTWVFSTAFNLSPITQVCLRGCFFSPPRTPRVFFFFPRDDCVPFLCYSPFIHVQDELPNIQDTSSYEIHDASGPFSSDGWLAPLRRPFFDIFRSVGRWVGAEKDRPSWAGPIPPVFVRNSHLRLGNLVSSLGPQETFFHF